MSPEAELGSVLSSSPSSCTPPCSPAAGWDRSPSPACTPRCSGNASGGAAALCRRRPLSFSRRSRERSDPPRATGVTHSGRVAKENLWPDSVPPQLHLYSSCVSCSQTKTRDTLRIGVCARGHMTGRGEGEPTVRYSCSICSTVASGIRSSDRLVNSSCLRERMSQLHREGKKNMKVY